MFNKMFDVQKLNDSVYQKRVSSILGLFIDI